MINKKPGNALGLPKQYHLVYVAEHHYCKTEVVVLPY